MDMVMFNDRYYLVELYENITHENVSNYDTKIEEWKQCNIILDCKNIKEIDASGLALIVSLCIENRKQGNTFNCINLYGQPLNLFKILNIYSLVKAR